MNQHRNIQILQSLEESCNPVTHLSSMRNSFWRSCTIVDIKSNQWETTKLVTNMSDVFHGQCTNIQVHQLNYKSMIHCIQTFLIIKSLGVPGGINRVWTWIQRGRHSGCNCISWEEVKQKVYLGVYQVITTIIIIIIIINNNNNNNN